MQLPLNKLLVGAALSALSLPAAADVIVLDFEGVGNFAAINDFYNGGTDSDGNAGPNFGIEFSGNTLGLVDADAGGDGNFANEPTPDTVMFWLDNNSAVMNVAAGFDTGFSFFYTSSTAATINVYDALNASGNIIGSIDLVSQHTQGCSGDPNGTFCNWDAIGVEFAGTAFSIDFGGTANQTGYDNITFGAAIPGDGGSTPPQAVPAPATLGLLGLGLLGLGMRRRAA